MTRHGRHWQHAPACHSYTFIFPSVYPYKIILMLLTQCHIFENTILWEPVRIKFTSGPVQFAFWESNSPELNSQCHIFENTILWCNSPFWELNSHTIRIVRIKFAPGTCINIESLQFAFWESNLPELNSQCHIFENTILWEPHVIRLFENQIHIQFALWELNSHQKPVLNHCNSQCHIFKNTILWEPHVIRLFEN